MRIIRLAAIAASLCTVAGLASAQITTIGPFTGNAGTEGFETQLAGSFDPCIVGRAFTNQADVCAGAAHITGGWGFGCSIGPNSGGRLYGSAGGPTTITFDQCVSRFGGYFGNHTPSGTGGTITFYDDANVVVASMLYVSPNDCQWYWKGWDFGGQPIKAIEITLNAHGGGFQLLDDLEADIGPCTGSGNSGASYCFGDGTGASCPCSAFGAPGEGCANTTGLGAVLTGSGNGSFANDTFQLGVTGVPGDKPGLILRGDSQIAVPAGDGILCTSGATQRSHVQVTSMGSTTFSDFNGAPFGSVANAGGVATNFQFWYRDPSNTCTGAGFNFTNAWMVTYTP